MLDANEVSAAAFWGLLNINREFWGKGVIDHRFIVKTVCKFVASSHSKEQGFKAFIAGVACRQNGSSSLHLAAESRSLNGPQLLLGHGREYDGSSWSIDVRQNCSDIGMFCASRFGNGQKLVNSVEPPLLSPLVELGDGNDPPASILWPTDLGVYGITGEGAVDHP